jgi:hypothetical protein
MHESARELAVIRFGYLTSISVKATSDILCQLCLNNVWNKICNYVFLTGANKFFFNAFPTLSRILSSYIVVETLTFILLI